MMVDDSGHALTGQALVNEAPAGLHPTGFDPSCEVQLPSAERRLLGKLSRRWIKGTGSVHGSVVRDLIEAGLVDHRTHRGEQQIRALASREKHDAQ